MRRRTTRGAPPRVEALEDRRALSGIGAGMMIPAEQLAQHLIRGETIVTDQNNPGMIEPYGVWYYGMNPVW